MATANPSMGEHVTQVHTRKNMNNNEYSYKYKKNSMMTPTEFSDALIGTHVTSVTNNNSEVKSNSSSLAENCQEPCLTPAMDAENTKSTQTVKSALIKK